MKYSARRFGVIVGLLTALSASLGHASQIELISGTSDIFVSDGGVGDMSSGAGQILWLGNIHGWNLTVTVADTKPNLGSATSPQLDLTVTANTPGLGDLVVKFSETDFGPTSGSLNSSFFQNGTSLGTGQVLVDPSNQLFGGAASTDANLTGPYSLTLVDTFAVGTISADHRASVSSVPDGGTTAAMLGFGLTGLGVFRRKLLG